MLASHDCPIAQTFSTCANSSSTGVARPKIDTATLSRRLLLVDFLDDAVERGERAVGDPHLLADLEGDRRLRPLDAFLHLMQDPLGLVRR